MPIMIRERGKSSDIAEELLGNVIAIDSGKKKRSSRCRNRRTKSRK